ncbi:hypothetical protein PMZ80_001086 [Knufia obscura]|uniref:Major facilitator superfamily transporter n=1 Tax=Knufia obscura TaxID=1635080 RepID=A0ABR0S2B7_9EURO|nr:hypothetical protein PMZ80_001086 [Knufia obscura]
MDQTRSRNFSDVEKRRIPAENDYDYESEDEDPESATTSRSVSSQHAPMLNRAYSHRDRTGSLVRLRPSVMRYACLGVAGILLLFILSLVRFSQQSQKEVQQAIIQDKQSPKPPVWEDFPFLERYYGGVRALIPRKDNKPEYPLDGDEVPVRIEPAQPDPEVNTETEPETDATEAEDKLPAKRDVEGAAAVPDSVVFDPYPNYKSEEYIAEYGEKVDCFLDDKNTVQIPRVRIYEAVPQGFPDNVMGSAELLGMRHDICYDRFGRLGPYGLGYSLNKGGSGAQQEGEREGADLVWKDHPEVDFRNVKWADVQQRCNEANAHRFKEQPEARTQRFQTMQTGAHVPRAEDANAAPADNAHAEPKAGKSKIPRTAVVIRTWWDYQYTPEDLIYLRSLISELNVLSGGKYTVHFLIHLKDDNAQIWSDDEVYERVLHDSLPEEFRGMGTLWTERQMFLVYGGLEETWMRGLPVHGVYRSTFMPMQYFAYQHPEYDFFWHWEMDVRSTNHWYHFFESVSNWARKQPRKYLWERNARFYVPAEHGTWDDFSHMVRIQTDQGTNSANNVWSGLRAGGREPGTPDHKMSGDRAVWGPERPLDDDVVMSDLDGEPPTSFDKDKYTWGVNEDADLISFNPFFDPDGTSWLLADDTTGYNITRGRPPRRTVIITASRLSRKLLMAMHRELSHNRHTMFSEMWPATCALHHGLKAVYAPHPVYIDRRWPTSYLEKTFNGGRNGASGGARTSVFGDREHNFRGTTWYYNAGFPEVLWHRWLGMKIHNDGGEVFEMEGEGRMCLPGMMLHPIKRVELVQEGKKAD